MTNIAPFLYSDIKSIISNARTKSFQFVNSAMVEAYWNIGKRIVDEEQKGSDRATYGEQILQNLSKELTSEFGKGFSYSNLRNFRQFYLTYPDIEICYTLCSKLTWSHNRLIMRIEDKNARQYYLEETATQNWSVRNLERNINTFYYQRTLSSKQKNSSLPAENIEEFQINDFIKDPYIFEFLDLAQPLSYSEKDIESGLISNLQNFIMELGKGFSFVARQQRISTETDHFYIDLVFYNYLLKCFVIIDLKTGKLTHQDIGQMDMYRRMYDELKARRRQSNNRNYTLYRKSETVVKYSIMNDTKQLFATKYMPYLPSEAELIAEIEKEKRLLKFKNNDK